MSVVDLNVPERVKLVFIDGNLSTGNVVVKKGTIVEIDDQYVYFRADDTPSSADIVRIGHNFVVKTVPLKEGRLDRMEESK